MTDTEKARSGGKNLVLAALLAELGWSHARAVREANAFMGSGYVGRSSVAEWVHNGRVPREPLPTVVAHLLSDAVGRKITVTQLWGAGVKDSAFWLAADHGQQHMTWDYSGVVRCAEDWVVNAGRTMDGDRRQFMAISGVALTGVAWAFTENMPSKTFMGLSEHANTSDTVKVTPSIVSILESTIKDIEVLDHQEGSEGNNLRFMHGIFTTIAGYVKADNFSDESTRNRLLTAWAQLCRIGGFMAFDAGQHGLAQRLFYTGLQVAGTLSDRQLGAHILTHLCHQAVYRGNPTDAVQLAEAAMETATHSGNLAVQAFTTSRCALAQAAMGNTYACKVAMDKAYDLLNSHRAVATRPSHMYWLTPAMLETHRGETLISLAAASIHSNPSLVAEAERLLTPHLTGTSDFRQEFPRDILIRGSHLARGYVKYGELDKAVAIGKKLLKLTPKIHSYRAVTLLRTFTKELKQHRGAMQNPETAELAHQLNNISI